MWGSASEPITNIRSCLNRKLIWPPTTIRPPYFWTNPTERRSPSSWFDTSSKSVGEAPGANRPRCSASWARAKLAAMSGEAVAPGAGMPEPQIRLGTPVARSNAPSQRPVAASFCQSGVAGAPHRSWRSTRSGLASAAPAIAVKLSAATRRSATGTTAPAGAAAATAAVTSTAKPRARIAGSKPHLPSGAKRDPRDRRSTRRSKPRSQIDRAEPRCASPA